MIRGSIVYVSRKPSTYRIMRALMLETGCILYTRICTCSESGESACFAVARADASLMRALNVVREAKAVHGLQT